MQYNESMFLFALIPILTLGFFNIDFSSIGDGIQAIAEGLGEAPQLFKEGDEVVKVAVSMSGKVRKGVMQFTS